MSACENGLNEGGARRRPLFVVRPEDEALPLDDIEAAINGRELNPNLATVSQPVPLPPTLLLPLSILFLPLCKGAPGCGSPFSEEERGSGGAGAPFGECKGDRCPRELPMRTRALAAPVRSSRGHVGGSKAYARTHARDAVVWAAGRRRGAWGQAADMRRSCCSGACAKTQTQRLKG